MSYDKNINEKQYSFFCSICTESCEVGLNGSSFHGSFSSISGTCAHTFIDGGDRILHSNTYYYLLRWWRSNFTFQHTISCILWTFRCHASHIWSFFFYTLDILDFSNFSEGSRCFEGSISLAKECWWAIQGTAVNVNLVSP
jgi:hypothetical protein